MRRGRKPCAPSDRRPRISSFRLIRGELGLTLDHVSMLSGVSRSVLRRFDRHDGVSTVRIGDLACVAGALGVAPTDLLPGLANRPLAPKLRGPAVAYARQLVRQARTPLRRPEPCTSLPRP